MELRRQTEIFVLGAGPAGYAAAFLAADAGKKVIIADREAAPGGVCLFRGCIPSKTLLHAAKVVDDAVRAKDMGIDFCPPEIHIDRLQQYRKEAISKLSFGLMQSCKSKGIDFIQGRAVFLDSKTAEVTPISSKKIRISFDSAIIAAGSHPVMLPFLPGSEHILNSTACLELDAVPRSLLVIGGGYIGLELGVVYSRLGSNVTVAEMLSYFLPAADKDLSDILYRRISRQFEAILFNTQVIAAEEKDGGIEVIMKAAGAGESKRRYNKVLVAAGRRPNSQGLGIENTGVVLDEKGFIRVDSGCRTNDPAFYAAGDITGEPMLAHKALAEGRVAADNILGRKPAFGQRVIPAVVFTDPEIAWCGLTQTDAERGGRKIAVVKFPWLVSGRAMTLNRREGMTKLIIDPDSRRILGAGIAGVNCGELISEAVLAIETGCCVDDLAQTIHPHPTLSETLMDAAQRQQSQWREWA